MTAMLVNGLINRGYKVVAYTTSTNLKEPLVYKGKDLTLCIGRRDPHAGRDLFYSERKDLLGLMRENPVDIINAQWSYEFALAAIASGIPTLVTLHDHALTILKYQFDPYRLTRLLMNNLVLKKAKYLSVNSEYLYKLLSKTNKDKAKIIHNFNNDELEKYFKEIPQKLNYIVSVSNGFGKLKNIKNGLRAFKIVKQKLKDIEYHLVGVGMEPNGPAYDYAKDNELLEGVTFLGVLSFAEVIDEITKASIFLHPSREESFGMVVLEAMVLGTLVIGGENSGNIPYLLNNGKAGVLCDINSPTEIADVIINLFNNVDLRNKLRRNAFEFARLNFSENYIISRYISHYKSILKM